MSGMLAMVKENWPNFLYGKSEDEVKVTRANWLRQLGGFPVEKIEEAAVKMVDRFPGEYAPNAPRVKALVAELTLVRPEHRLVPPKLPPPPVDEKKAAIQMNKIKEVLGIRS